MNRIIYSLLFAALLFWRPTSEAWHELWLVRWGIFVFLFGSFLVWRTRLGVCAKAFLVYYLFSSFLTCYLHGYQAVDDWAKVLAQGATGEHLVLMFTFLAYISLEIDTKGGLLIACLITLSGMIVSTLLGTPHHVLFWGNPRLAGTFVILASGLNPFLSIPALLLARSWTAFIVVLGVLGVRHWPRSPWVKFGVLGACLVVPWALWGHDHDRFFMWSESFRYWMAQGHPWMGWGPGASKVWLPAMGLSHGVGKPKGAETIIYVWAHNDWLQGLFEFGVIGTVLFLAAALEFFWRSKDKPIVAGFYLTMLVNYPTHIAPFALLGWELVRRSVKDRPTYSTDIVRRLQSFLL